MLGLVAMTGVLAACTGAPAGDGGASITPSADTPAIAQTFDVGGGRMMYLECTGSGSPTVVLVAGQRASADDWMGIAQGVSGEPVFTRVGAGTRVCAYDRPGTPVGESPSRSDPVPQPADAASMVADLNALLAAGGIEEPFVIAGHSAGGLVARLYAMTYPDAVSGMMLVDALSEGRQEYMSIRRSSGSTRRRASTRCGRRPPCASCRSSCSRPTRRSARRSRRSRRPG